MGSTEKKECGRLQFIVNLSQETDSDIIDFLEKSDEKRIDIIRNAIRDRIEKEQCKTNVVVVSSLHKTYGWENETYPYSDKEEMNDIRDSLITRFRLEENKAAFVKSYAEAYDFKGELIYFERYI